MNKFELFAGCLGNGITLCNKAVIADGDYKVIGHISEGGNLKLYVKQNSIPAKDMETINQMVQENKNKFRTYFESQSETRQYATILNSMPLGELVDNHKDKRPLSEKLPELREKYYKTA